MESQPQNPEFRINPENFQPCIFATSIIILTLCITGIFTNSEDPDEMQQNAA